jgi:hypothetical protein
VARGKKKSKKKKKSKTTNKKTHRPPTLSAPGKLDPDLLVQALRKVEDRLLPLPRRCCWRARHISKKKKKKKKKKKEKGKIEKIEKSSFLIVRPAPVAQV